LESGEAMNATIELRWVASLSASACHVADLARRGLAGDCLLVQAVARPAQWFGEKLRAAQVDEAVFWPHLLAFSVEVENNRQLIEAVLRRMAPSRDCSESRVVCLAACVADIEAAVRRAQPELVEELLSRAERVRAAWDERGVGLLTRVGDLTDAGVIASSATVAPLWPAWGGYALAYLPRNVARMELDTADPQAVPDVVRLAWLLAQLNLDLPMFSEMIAGDCLGALAALAMLPAVLQAADEAKISDGPPPSLERALEALRIEVRDRSLVAEKLDRWWQSYLDVRPDWDVALAALGRMVEGLL
jgi:hypothetical protein